MKNRVFVILTLAAIALAACSEVVQPEENASAVRLVADFIPVHADGADTKAVKSSWEDGDVIFIFFQGVTTGSRYLEMRYDNGFWTTTAKNGLTSADLTPDGSKTLTAVYMPFCNDAVPTYAYENYMGMWNFDKTCSSYYMCADRVPYTVETSNDLASIAVSGNSLLMRAPDGFVQFFVEDAAAVDGGASLQATGMQSKGLASVGADGLLYESSKPVGSAMPGYAYKGGYLFSGMLDNSLGNVEADYHFKLMQGTSIQKATATGKTLQVSGTAGRAVNITRLSWSPDDLCAVPMFELNGSVRYFANMNIGSLSETDAGDYFAWGEMAGQQPTLNNNFNSPFSWDLYKWGYDDYSRGVLLTKYCTERSMWDGFGWEDNKTVLEPADDAASIYLGGLWRTPTLEEWTALTTKCDWTWETRSNVSGYVVTGRGYFAVNSIFLPARGLGKSGNLADISTGYYWSSSLNTGYPDCARNLAFTNQNRSFTKSCDRCWGLLVRPVMNE